MTPQNSLAHDQAHSLVSLCCRVPLALGHELVRLTCVAVHMDQPRLDVTCNSPFDRAAALIPLLWYIPF